MRRPNAARLGLDFEVPALGLYKRRHTIICAGSDTPRSLLWMDFRAELMVVFVPGLIRSGQNSRSPG